MARLLGNYMTSLVREVTALPTTAVSIAAKATLELIQLITANDDQPRESAPLRVAMLPQVLRRIERTLPDQDLNPGRIAEANAISVRTLHAMFVDTGESVSEYIRRRRLERARDSLVSVPEIPVIDVARHWGLQEREPFRPRVPRSIWTGAHGLSPHT